MATQGWKLCKKLATIQQNISEKTNVFKTECCGSSGQFPTERMKQKVCRFLSEIRNKKSLRSCSQWSVHCEIEAKKVTYEGERKSDQRLEMPTCECKCTEVQCTVRRVQLDLGHHCRSTTRGMTALVYWKLHSSLYTGAVQGYWSTPNWSDRHQGCVHNLLMCD